MSVNAEIIKEEGPSVHFSVSVSSEILSPIETSILNGYVNKANIKGFRPGKAPENIVKRNYASDITEAVLSRHLVKFLDEATSKLNIKKIGMYQLEDVKYNLGQPMYLKVFIERFPDFQYVPVDDVVVSTLSAEVSEKEVQDEIRDRAFKNAPFEMIADRNVLWDDFLIIDYKLSHEDEVIEEGSDKWFKVTKDFNIEGFCDHMVGMAIGESKSFSIKLPPEYQDEKWADKDVTGYIAVKSIRVKKMPELNDEWVLSQNMSYKTFDEYRESIKSVLQHQKNEKKKNHDRSVIEKKLLELYPFDVPENFLDKVFHEECHRLHEYYQSMGMPKDWLDQNKDVLNEQANISALKKIKLELIVDKIRSEHNLDATVEEIDARLLESATQQGKSLDAFKMELIKNKRFENFVAWIQFEKIWKWVESKVKFVESTVDDKAVAAV